MRRRKMIGCLIGIVLSLTACGSKKTDQEKLNSQFRDEMSQIYSEMEENLTHKQNQLQELINEANSIIEELKSSKEENEEQLEKSEEQLESASSMIELWEPKLEEAQRRLDKLNEAIQSAGYATKAVRDAIAVSLVVNSETYTDVTFYSTAEEALQEEKLLNLDSTEVSVYIDAIENMADKIFVAFIKSNEKVYNLEVNKQEEMFVFPLELMEGINVIEVTYIIKEESYTFYLSFNV